VLDEFLQVLHAKIGNTDETDFALFLQFQERCTSFGDIDFAIGPMDLIEIDDICAQIAQTALAGGDEIRAPEVGESHLGSDDRFVPPAGQGLPKHLFRFTISIRFGCIEEIDPCIQGGVHGSDRIRSILLTPGVDTGKRPAAQPDARNLQIGLSQSDNLHFLFSSVQTHE